MARGDRLEKNLADQDVVCQLENIFAALIVGAVILVVLGPLDNHVIDLVFEGVREPFRGLNE